MCIKLEQIEKISGEIVDFLQEHQDAYNIDGELHANDKVPDEIALYNIIYKNEIVGFFMLNFDVKNDCVEIEMEIGIFDNYQRNGIACKTIAYFLKYWGLNERLESGMQILATIKKENPCRDDIKKVLIRTGFKHADFTDTEIDKSLRPRQKENTEAEIKREKQVLEMMKQKENENPSRNHTYYIKLI